MMNPRIIDCLDCNVNKNKHQHIFGNRDADFFERLHKNAQTKCKCTFLHTVSVNNFCYRGFKLKHEA